MNSIESEKMCVAHITFIICYHRVKLSDLFIDVRFSLAIVVVVVFHENVEVFKITMIPNTSAL